MMKKQYLHGVLPLLILALFATTILSVLMSGAKIYKTLSQRDDESFTNRTAAQYITAKVKQTALQSDITVEAFGDTVALLLPVKYGTQMYITRLYSYEDNLYELFSASDVKMSPEDGEKVLSLSNLSANINENLLTMELTDIDGETTILHLYLKGGEEGDL